MSVMNDDMKWLVLDVNFMLESQKQTLQNIIASFEGVSKAHLFTSYTF